MGNEASLSMGAVQRETGERASLLGVLKDSCPLEGHNPGLLLASLLNITP
jgi:hypothetical protein